MVEEIVVRVVVFVAILVVVAAVPIAAVARSGMELSEGGRPVG